MGVKSLFSFLWVFFYDTFLDNKEQKHHCPDQKTKVGKKKKMWPKSGHVKKWRNCVNSFTIIPAFGRLRKGYCSLESQKAKGSLRNEFVRQT